MTDFLTRDLQVISGNEAKNFSIKISFPRKTSNTFECILDTQGVLSEHPLRAFGEDSIEAIEYAIHLVDVLIFERDNEFEIYWPDGSKYCRSSTLNYRWSSD